MATLTCTGCGAHLALSGRADCPRCHTALPGPAASTTPHVPPHAGSLMPRLALAVIVVLVVLIGYRVAVPSAAQQYERHVASALYTCQHALSGRLPSGTTPPFTRNFGSGDEFYFAWPAGSIPLPDGSTGFSASCIGRVSTGQITQLTINGRDVL
jgi:hypothetical protein